MLSQVRILLLSAFCWRHVQGICPLCATPAELPVRWNYRTASGETCQEVYIRLTRLSPNDPQCIGTKEQSEVACCGPDEPDPIDFPPSPAPTGEQGDQPPCDICGHDEFPGIPGAFIVARYVGEFSCRQLYHRGLNGLVPGFMCAPLQDFAFPVCGCGRFNPRCIADETQCFGYEPPPTEAPVTPRPTTSPVAVPVPTNPPVQAPTPAPVATPTNAPIFSLFERKIPRRNGKGTRKVSDGRGGAAGRLRGGRNLETAGDELPEQN